jgi:hypothetical protein
MELDMTGSLRQGDGAWDGFSLAWLEAKGNLSEGELALLIGSRFKKVV